MKSFVVLSLALACAVLAQADINNARKEGLKKLESQVYKIKDIAHETAAEAEKREGNIKIISKHIREYGDGIVGKTNFEVKQYAKSAYMMANLLQSKNDVFRCIESREREAQAEIDKTYTTQFVKPGQEFEMKAEEHQRNVIQVWKDDYYKVMNQYGEIYKKAVSEIQKATSESYINSVVKQFEDTSGRVAQIITDIHPRMARIHIDVLRTLDELLLRLLQYSKTKVDETIKKIQQCFPKLFQTNNFLSSIVL